MPDADPRDSDLERADEVVDGEIADGRSENADGRQQRLIAEHQQFSGPLPPPNVLSQYEAVQPGLADIIVSQWQRETEHRHATIDSLHRTDHESMEKYYEAEQRGQWIGLAAFLALLAIIVVALILGSDVGAIGGLIVAGSYAVWALRRRTAAPPPPVDLDEDGQDPPPD